MGVHRYSSRLSSSLLGFPFQKQPNSKGIRTNQSQSSEGSPIASDFRPVEVHWSTGRSDICCPLQTAANEIFSAAVPSVPDFSTVSCCSIHHAPQSTGASSTQHPQPHLPRDRIWCCTPRGTRALRAAKAKKARVRDSTEQNLHIPYPRRLVWTNRCLRTAALISQVMDLVHYPDIRYPAILGAWDGTGIANPTKSGNPSTPSCHCDLHRDHLPSPREA